MGVGDHAESFGGLPVMDYRAGEGLSAPETSAVRIGLNWEDRQTFEELLLDLLGQSDVDRLAGLVIGPWFTEDPYASDASSVVEALVAAAPQLTSLKALFLGDIVSEECEISWLQLSNVSPLWTAYPQLEHFAIRGSSELSLGDLQHDFLRSFRIECGGLPRAVIGQVTAARLPALESLELYLGDSGYGWDGTIEDVRPLLATERFPSLKYLGLRNCEIADEVAQAAAASPWIGRLETLDLSLGTLTDEGGQALLNCEAINSLKKLDLHHHYMSTVMAQALVKKFADLPIQVDCSGRQEPSRYGGGRYVAVGE